MMPRGLAAGMIAALAAFGPALAYPDGAPAGYSGGFDEPACGECHFGGEPVEPSGLSLAGLGETFEPGVTYELELRLYLSNLAVGGFQLTARFAEGPMRGRSAGGLAGDGGTGLELADGVAYIGHREVARPAGEGEAVGWRIRWTAPGEAQAVVFHAAAVAGNDDHSPIGDIVHQLELRSDPK
jgi:hypothetical protein